MREAFLMANKYSGEQILNPLFEFCMTLFNHFTDLPKRQQKQVILEVDDINTSMFKQSMLKHRKVISQYEWFYQPESFNLKTDPVLLYFHGGGFAIKLVPMSLIYLNNIRKYYPKIGIVLSDYSVTDSSIQKSTYPLQVLEAFSLYDHLTQDMGCENVILMGESAGGNITLALLLYLQKCNIKLPQRVIAISPWLNPAILINKEKEFMHENAALDNLSIQGLDLFKTLYTPIIEFSQGCTFDPLFNLENNFEPDEWAIIIEKCKLLITYGDDEILQLQIGRFIEKLADLNKIYFLKEKNAYIDKGGCHIRPILSLTTNIEKWSKQPSINRILEFLEQ